MYILNDNQYYELIIMLFSLYIDVIKKGDNIYFTSNLLYTKIIIYILEYQNSASKLLDYNDIIEYIYELYKYMSISKFINNDITKINIRNYLDNINNFKVGERFIYDLYNAIKYEIFSFEVLKQNINPYNEPLFLR